MNQPSFLSRALLLIFRVLFTFFALSTMVFIFSNSLEIASVSSMRSGEIMAKLNAFLARGGFAPLSEHAVRKLAHFCEYALLSFWYTLCLRVYTRHYIRHISWPLFLTLLMANADETLQTFVAGRSGQLSDVWIDFTGGLAGIFCGLALILALAAFWHLLGFGRHRKN